MSLFV